MRRYTIACVYSGTPPRTYPRHEIERHWFRSIAYRRYRLLSARHPEYHFWIEHG